MTSHASPQIGPIGASLGEPPALQALDLSPQGLADAPASQLDPDSIVYVGNS